MGKPGGSLNSLLVIKAEDIGLVDPTLVTHVGQCHDTFNSSLDENKVSRSEAATCQSACGVIDQAVIAAAVCYKSRLLPMMVFATLFDIYNRETFSYDLSEYLRRFFKAVKNRDEKEALYYAFIVALLLKSEDSIFEIIEKESKKRNGNLIQEWIQEYKRKKKDVTNNKKLMLAGIVALIFRDLNYSRG